MYLNESTSFLSASSMMGAVVCDSEHMARKASGESENSAAETSSLRCQLGCVRTPLVQASSGMRFKYPQLSSPQGMLPSRFPGSRRCSRSRACPEATPALQPKTSFMCPLVRSMELPSLTGAPRRIRIVRLCDTSSRPPSSCKYPAHLPYHARRRNRANHVGEKCASSNFAACPFRRTDQPVIEVLDKGLDKAVECLTDRV